MKTIKTILSELNEAFKTNLSKEVESFPVEGYRFNQLQLADHDVPENIDALINSEFTKAIDKSKVTPIIKALVEANSSYRAVCRSYRGSEFTISLYDKTESMSKKIDSIDFKMSRSRVEILFVYKYISISIFYIFCMYYYKRNIKGT